jgi:uncharacterized protein (TIGR04222 family)
LAQDVSMDGPTFLLVYGALVTTAIVGVRWYNRTRDPRANEPLPPVPSPADPYELAWLRGGTAETTRLAVYDLRQRGLLETPKPGSAPSANYVVAAVNADQQPGLPPLGRLLLRICVTPHHPRRLLHGESAMRMEEGCLHWRRRHEDNGFLENASQRSQKWFLLLGVGLLLVIISVVRIQNSIAHGHYNIIFLILMTIATVIALPVLARPIGRLTPRGVRYLARLKQALAPAVTTRSTSRNAAAEVGPSDSAINNTNSSPAPAGNDSWSPASAAALVPVALLGMSAMDHSDRQHMEEIFPQAAKRDQHSNAGSGCGSASCGSASSSWSFSSEGSNSDSGSSGSSGDSGGASGCGGGGCGGGGD